MQHVRIFKHIGWALGAVTAATSLLPSGAEAAGIEDTVPGTAALGRAANYARVNDFMATWQNPANLAVVMDDAGLELRVPIFGACFDRARNNSVTYRVEDSFDEECNDASPFPAGNVGFAMKLGEKLGLGAGIFTPAGVGNLKFGTDTIVTTPTEQMLENQMYDVTRTGTMSPNRYLLLERNVLAAFAGVGVGYSPMPQLRFGLMLASGFADVSYKNVASLAPGFTDQEVVNDVKVADYFIPRITGSIAATPTDALDLMLSFTWNDDIGAEGHVDVSANGIQGAPLGDCYAKMVSPSGQQVGKPGPRCRIDDATLDVPYQRFEAILGLRYAARTVARSGVLDPLSQEKWDVEIDAFWVNTGNVDDFALELYDPATPSELAPTVQFASAPDSVGITLPARASLPHNWKDTYGVRAGGDYNVMPGKLAVRLGAAYETRAVPVENMNIDYWPVSKIAAHVGLTYRVGPVDLSAAYVHIFNETIDVAVGQGNVREVTALFPETAGVVNEGRYRSQVDVISLQGTVRF